MLQITQEKAQKLLDTKAAGFYAVWANPPIPHDEQIYVVQIGQDFYLTEKGEMELVPIGVDTILQKVAIEVKVNADNLGELLMNEVKKCKRLDDGLEVPVYATRSLEPRSEKDGSDHN